jgi:hypothetical protein
MNILEVNDLQKTFASQIAVDKISLQLGAGIDLRAAGTQRRRQNYPDPDDHGYLLS